VIIVVHEKFEKNQNISIEDLSKTANNSRSIFNVKKLLTGINAKINELSCDMLFVAKHLVFEEIFANYSMGTHGIPWVIHVLNGWMMGGSMQSSGPFANKFLVKHLLN
jgi:hypothetical protein